MSFIKVKKYKCQDGSITKYYYYAKAYRENGVPKSKVYYLGKHKWIGLIKFLIKRRLGLVMWK